MNDKIKKFFNMPFLEYYSELVIVTVFSLVAANLWFNAVKKTRDECLPLSYKFDFLLAVIVTLLAIITLKYTFSK